MLEIRERLGFQEGLLGERMQVPDGEEAQDAVGELPVNLVVEKVNAAVGHVLDKLRN